MKGHIFPYFLSVTKATEMVSAASRDCGSDLVQDYRIEEHVMNGCFELIPNEALNPMIFVNPTISGVQYLFSVIIA